MNIELVALAAFLVTFFTSVACVFTKHIHGSFTLDKNSGIQKMHITPTPRIGGAAIAFGFLAAFFLLKGEVRLLFGFVGLAGLPAFLFGLAEDVTKQIGVKARLLATIASGLIFAALTGYTVNHVEMALIDSLLAYPLLAFAFTGFAIGGVANAVNLIDGFHGLASGTLIIILLAFALVGWRVEDTTFMAFGLIFAAIIAGFFIVNFPFGKLFLGDAGAYFSGYVVAVMAVMLPARNPEVSPWVSLLILSYPVTETVISIIRRMMDKNTHPGAPDDQHLHHIVHRNLAKKTAARVGFPGLQNATTSLFMWSLPLVTLLALGRISTFEANSALGLIGLGVALYVFIYRRILAVETARELRALNEHTSNQRQYRRQSL